MPYKQDPNDPTKVIDTSVLPPSIDPQDIANQIDELDKKRIKPAQIVANIDSEKAALEQQLEDIYAQVPEVKPEAALN